ncbi:USP9_24 [Lepeophtheirus salmonis]|uniref:USP9_24 n=1 Tax=Lepeophtheirus salmonis TaxID=72036 RepID=A0A7R8CI54_LEPSM|nr:USP9_24 [Lepeophtheirus salmonis]CAF2826128.1 USP9_24 [Lepeophtheirus salmonis]
MDPYVLRYKVDMAWFLLPPDKRRIYEVEATLISDPSSPVLNPLYYQQEDEQYLKYIKEQCLKKRTPANENLYLGYNEEPINLVKEKKDTITHNINNTKVQTSDSLISQESISLRQSGFLYFVETCRLNFNYLGGNVLKFNNNCCQAWSVLSEEIKEQFQAFAERELHRLRYNNSDSNTTLFPHSIRDLYLIDLKFTIDKYESLILDSFRNKVDNIFPHARSTTTDSVKLNIVKEHARRRKRVHPQGLAAKVDVMTSKEKKLNQTKVDSSMLDYQRSLNESVKVRGSGRFRKDPNAPKKPMTSYLYFVCEQRKIIRKMNPSFSFSKVSKLLGIEWKKIRFLGPTRSQTMIMNASDDENISTLLSMGFPDIDEIKKALSVAKNDLNEAVNLLTSYEDIDMKDMSPPNNDENSDENGKGFPLRSLNELETRVFQDNWTIPYKKEESFAKCLSACLRVPADDPHAKKFLERVLPEAFNKLLTSPAVAQNDWNNKNKDQDVILPSSPYIRPLPDYGWIRDLLHLFGKEKGFLYVSNYFTRKDINARTMTALLAPLAGCCTLISDDVANKHLKICTERAFEYIRNISDFRSKDVSSVSDLLISLKRLSLRFWHFQSDLCDTLRLSTVVSMLKTPFYNSRMNALKEVSRLIDESRNEKLKNVRIEAFTLTDWMSQNCVLSAAFEVGAYHSQKAEKSTLVELNKQHEIVRLLTESIRYSHNLSVKSCSPLKVDSIIDGKYTHHEYIHGHLELMAFFLKEGDLYLSWNHCEDLWNTLVMNPHAIKSDKDTFFNWIQMCLPDLERETQTNFFTKNLLRMDPANVDDNFFNCFKEFFQVVNMIEGGLLSKKSLSSIFIVENLELVGLDYFWQIVMHCELEEIAGLAIQYLLNMSYHHVATNLKRDPIHLHDTFINKCYEMLEKIFSVPEGNQDAVLEGCELETSVQSEGVKENDETATRILTSISVSKVSSLAIHAKGKTYNINRSILPHAASFHGRRIKIKVMNDIAKEELVVKSHTNETVGSLKRRIAMTLKKSVDSYTYHCGDVHLTSSKDRCFIGMMDFVDPSSDKFDDSDDLEVIIWTLKPAIREVLFSCPEEPEVIIEDGKEVEKNYSGTTLRVGDSDKRMMNGLRRLIHLIPTDPDVSNLIDSFVTENYVAAASPKFSMRKFDPYTKSLSDLFDASVEGMSAFRVLYNLEILSSKLMPTKVGQGPQSRLFAKDFLKIDGVKLILNVLDTLPSDIEYDIRQSVFSIVLQLSAFLLCGQTVVSMESSVIPTPPKKSAIEVEKKSSSSNNLV